MSADRSPARYAMTKPDATSAMVRSHCLRAGIAAALLLYFGFFAGIISLSLAADIMLWAMRIGGIAMGVSVLVLWSGHPLALAYDGIASMLIGAALTLSGVLWLMGGVDLQGFLNLIFGYLFATSGWRDFGEFRALSGSSEAAKRERGGLDAAPVRQFAEDRTQERAMDRAAEPASSSASQLIDQRRGGPPKPVPAADTSEPVSEPPNRTEPQQIDDTPDNPPDGFLASFAEPKKKPPDQ